MKSIIDKIFDGEINIMEQFVVTEEYKTAIDEARKCEKCFLNVVDEKYHNLYEEACDKKAFKDLIEYRQYFSMGVKIGFELAKELDVLED